MTLRRYTVHRGLQMTNGILTLVDALFQEAYICASVGSTSQDYNSRSGDPNFHAELFPVHSPLLRESCLVSYPPLTYMLKFSGFADLTSCLGKKAARAARRRGKFRRRKTTRKKAKRRPSSCSPQKSSCIACVKSQVGSLTHKHSHTTGARKTSA